MNTIHLRYALEVERTRSISRAAENLFMAQPNLSKAIHELEKSLGITIFERTSKGVVPTPNGIEFLSSAKRVLSELERMQEIGNSEEISKTKIAVPRGSYISSAFAKFAAKLKTPVISIDFKETNSMDTILSVSENNYNIGIIRYPVSNEKYFLDYLEEKELYHEKLWQFESRIIMNENDRYKNGDEIDYDELENMVELTHGDNLTPYISKPNNSPDAVKRKRIYFYERGSQFEILKYLSNSYIWVAPVPNETLSSFGLIQLKCKLPNNKFKDVLIYKKGYAMTELEKEFLAEIKRERDLLASSINNEER